MTNFLSCIFLILSCSITPLFGQQAFHSIYKALDSLHAERRKEEFRLDGPVFARGMVFRVRQEIFQEGDYQLKSEEVPVLDSIVRTMRLFPRITLEIRMCFSDSARAEQFGKLDRQRAAVVRDYLIRRGIAPTRMRAAAGGGRYPLISENWLKQIPEASQREYWRRYNERLEFVILNPAFE